ncbi:MAG: ABC transporter substrate-binding protein [Prevotella sp.]|nr:ABC transporter substrate-binding protein [Prevotella sp.]
MRKNMLLAVLCTVAAVLAGCRGAQQRTAAAADRDSIAVDDSAARIAPQYAEGFSVEYADDGLRLVTVSDPQKGEKSKTYRFALVPRGQKYGQLPEGYTPIEVPIRRSIAMTTLQLSNFIALGALDFVSGITSTRHLQNRDIKARIKDGRISQIGMEGNFDAEVIMAAAPDVIFISPFKRGGYEAIKETGITLVPHLGYKEMTPLGQAEWVKFIAMFIGREREANAFFDAVAARYAEVKALAASVAQRPTVFSGEMHGGNWFAVGGRNHLAQLFRDAGADYVLSDNEETGGIPMDFERLYAIAANADFWRILNSYPGDFSYEALRASEPRNADFKAFRERKVIYCNMKQTPYYEQSPVHPEQLLEDLVFAFHPELLPKDFEPTFYRLLEK